MKPCFFITLALIFNSNLILAQKIEWMSFSEAQEAQKKEPKKIFMDVYTEWCGPCKTLLPVLDEVASETGENASVFKVNVDENGDLAQKYGIRGIPTMIFF